MSPYCRAVARSSLRTNEIPSSGDWRSRRGVHESRYVRSDAMRRLPIFSASPDNERPGHSEQARRVRYSNCWRVWAERGIDRAYATIGQRVGGYERSLRDATYGVVRAEADAETRLSLSQQQTEMAELERRYEEEGRAIQLQATAQNRAETNRKRAELPARTRAETHALQQKHAVDNAELQAAIRERERKACLSGPRRGCHAVRDLIADDTTAPDPRAQSVQIAAAPAGAQHGTAFDIEDGKRVYQASCANCHGPDGNLIAGIDFNRALYRRPYTNDELVGIVIPGFRIRRCRRIPGPAASRHCASSRTSARWPRAATRSQPAIRNAAARCRGTCYRAPAQQPSRHRAFEQGRRTMLIATHTATRGLDWRLRRVRSCRPRSARQLRVRRSRPRDRSAPRSTSRFGRGTAPANS